MFQKRMQRSAVPPPEASSPFWWGDQAMAFTAAVCSLKRSRGCVESEMRKGGKREGGEGRGGAGAGAGGEARGGEGKRRG